MKRVEDLIPSIQEFDFLLEYKGEQAPLIKIKLLALHHLQSGKSLQDTADITLYDIQAIRSWIRRFAEFDYEGLIERSGRGKKPRLTSDEEENFKDALDKFHESKNGDRITVDEIQ